LLIKGTVPGHPGVQREYSSIALLKRARRKRKAKT
jgi:hypothetical protein